VAICLAISCLVAQVSPSARRRRRRARRRLEHCAAAEPAFDGSTRDGGSSVAVRPDAPAAKDRSDVDRRAAPITTIRFHTGWR
jgi:hypothetical protein